jgi:hypothetical protein
LKLKRIHHKGTKDTKKFNEKWKMKNQKFGRINRSDRVVDLYFRPLCVLCAFVVNPLLCLCGESFLRDGPLFFEDA